METCPNCRLGRLHPNQITYPCSFKGQLMLVPNTPVQVCDVCHHIEYDFEFMSGIQILIQHSETQPKPSTKTPIDKPARKSVKRNPTLPVEVKN